jgi:hypothetical protein
MFLLFVSGARAEAVQGTLVGEWAIHGSAFLTQAPADVTDEYFSISLAQAADSADIEGELFLRNDTAPVDRVGAVRFSFDPIEESRFTVALGDPPTEVAEIALNSTETGFRPAVGRLLLSEFSYSLAILSYKAIELTLMNEAENRVTVYRMAKRVDPPSSGGITQYLPLMLVLWFLCGNRKRGGEEEGPQEDAGEEGEPPAQKEKQD